MQVILVAAASENNVIGNKGQLPWKLPKDLQHFRQLTEGKCIVMGRKTFDSIGRPLPKRKNIVVTRQERISFAGCEVVHSLGDAVALARALAEHEVLVIGGGELYREALPLAHRIELTRVHAQVEGDTYFPPLDPAQWAVVSEEHHPADEEHSYPFSFLRLERKGKGG